MAYIKKKRIKPKNRVTGPPERLFYIKAHMDLKRTYDDMGNLVSAVEEDLPGDEQPPAVDLNAPAIQTKEPSANLIASVTRTGKHAPVLDLDFPCRLVPSSTEGHFHLYIDHEITWEKYERLLIGLYDAGLIQKGWFENARKDKRTYVRKIGVYKPGATPQTMVDSSQIKQLENRIEQLEAEKARLQDEVVRLSRTSNAQMTWN